MPKFQCAQAVWYTLSESMLFCWSSPLKSGINQDLQYIEPVSFDEERGRPAVTKCFTSHWSSCALLNNDTLFACTGCIWSGFLKNTMFTKERQHIRPCTNNLMICTHIQAGVLLCEENTDSRCTKMKEVQGTRDSWDWYLWYNVSVRTQQKTRKKTTRLWTTGTVQL